MGVCISKRKANNQAQISIIARPTQDTPKAITIVHFNDVYNIEPRDREPVGGAARFKTAVESLSDRHPLVLFSGDALAPSSMSIVTEGRQMVPVLNSLNIQAAVYGNHEFDFGVEHLVNLAEEFNFPWLMTNVLDKYTDRQLADGDKYIIIDWRGVKVGVMGLVEEEWLATLATLTVDDVVYTDFVESAKFYIPILQEQGCELVVALTHMRMPNDKRLAQCVPDIDLILGGHDHHYESCVINNVPIVKSGTDFREFSSITVSIGGGVPESGRRHAVHVDKHVIDRNVKEDPAIKEIVESYMKKVQDGLEEELATINCCLDGRFRCVRTQETNLGNLICDVMRTATRADCAILNSGTLRSDVLHESGSFKMKDLLSILPMVDALTVLEITGEQLVQALENGVSQYPKHEGRFPQVSGLSFTFDPNQSQGSRVIRESIAVNGEKLLSTKKYKLCTKGYLAAGKDGYEVFKSLPILVSEEEGPVLSNVVRNYFVAKSRGSCTASATSLHSSFLAMTDECDGDGIEPQVEGRIVVCG